MSETHAATENHHESGFYEIRIKGHLDDKWADWFEGLSITLEENGETLLTGPMSNQTVLHGLLRKVRDLGMPLVSVIPMSSKQANRPVVNVDNHNCSKRRQTHEHQS